jgi:predicted transposase YdaD
MPAVLAALSKRLIHEASLEQAATLWAATRVLMGLRYAEKQVEEFFEGVSAMILGIRGIEESSVYQGIFAKGEARGRTEEARQALLHLGFKRLGQPDERVQTRLDAIDDLDRLNALLERILDVSSRDELMAGTDPSL